MNTVLQAIAKASFLASEQQVENLAAIVVEGHTANGTYLKVLVAHCLAAIAGKRKPGKKAQVSIVDEVQARLYAHVLAGVGPTDLDADERNRRATFSRTAASDLRGYIRRGGPLRKLDAETVTKHVLRSYGRKVPKGTRTRAQRSFVRSLAAIERAVTRIARNNPADARKRLEAARKTIDTLLAKLPAPAAHKTATRARPTRPATRVTATRLVRTPAQPAAH